MPITFDGERFVNQLLDSYKEKTHFDGSSEEWYHALSLKVYGGAWKMETMANFAMVSPRYAAHLNDIGFYSTQNREKMVRVYRFKRKDYRTIKGWILQVRDGKWTERDTSLEFLVSLGLACGLSRDEINNAADALCEDTLSGKGVRKLLINLAANKIIDFAEITVLDGEEPDAKSCGLYIDLCEHILEVTEEYKKRVREEPQTRGRIPTTSVLETLTGARDKEHAFEMLRCDPTLCFGILDDSEELSGYIESVVRERMTRFGYETRREYFSQHAAYNLNGSYSKMLVGGDVDKKWFIKLCIQLRLNAEETNRIRQILHLGAGDLNGCFDAAAMALGNYEEDGDDEALYCALDRFVDNNPDYSSSHLQTLYKWNAFSHCELNKKLYLCCVAGDFIARRVLPELEDYSVKLPYIPYLLYTWLSQKANIFAADQENSFSMLREASEFAECDGNEKKEDRYNDVLNWYISLVYTTFSGRVYREGQLCSVISPISMSTIKDDKMKDEICEGIRGIFASLVNWRGECDLKDLIKGAVAGFAAYRK